MQIKQVLNRIVAKAYYEHELASPLGKHTGNNWYRTNVLCPFHDDKHVGTFHINAETGKYKCFSCGAGGDMIDFHKHKYKLETKDALKSIWEKHYA